MKKTCIFDLDGTLTNSLYSIAHFLNAETAKYGIPPVDAEEFKILTGNGARKLVQRVLERAGKNDKALEEKILTEYNAAYDADPVYLCEAYPGIKGLLADLTKNGISVNVLSNKPHPTTEKVVKTIFGENTFSCILGARDSVALKPDPAGVYEILKILKLEKKDCLYIGDTATDVQTGKNAGLFTIGVLWGFRKRPELEQAGADAIISSPEEILKIALG